MPTSMAAATDSSLKVRYTRKVQEKRGDGEKNQMEILDEEHQADLGSQKAGPDTQKHPAAVKTCRCKATAVTLGLMYLLISAGIFARYILITMEKDQLQTRYDKLSNNYSQLQEKISRKWCPEGWKRFGCSCYFKSNEQKTWYESRDDCLNNGADLVIINDREEQEFVIELNMNGESWIGLRQKWTTKGQAGKWEWVDRSPLTEMFWAPGLPQPSWNQKAACCDQQGQWTQRGLDSKNWICEK